MFNLISSYAALIASIWIVFGVYITAQFYQNYSHAKQFCSELGAKNAPTEKLSPRINNYPLGLLLCLFGWHVITLDEAPVLIFSRFAYNHSWHRDLGCWLFSYGCRPKH